jgi:hypothetical protein
VQEPHLLVVTDLTDVIQQRGNKQIRVLMTLPGQRVVHADQVALVESGQLPERLPLFTCQQVEGGLIAEVLPAHCVDRAHGLSQALWKQVQHST